MQRWLASLFGIILTDLVLSGDNAVVIGLACRDLPDKQRKQGIFLGALVAIALRIFFATVATFLLVVPLLKGIGGALLLWIAWKLVRHDEQAHGEVSAAASLREAVQTVAMADVLMSLDNVLAVASLAHGDILMLSVGVAMTIPFIIWGSSLVAWLARKLPWLTWAGAALLTWTAGRMVAEDNLLQQWLPQALTSIHWLLPAAVTVITLLPALYLSLRVHPATGGRH